ncbi:ABC transporter substrate-binding protein [Cohnella silvisoli]|uniref:Extracellular solute-binding protein n=1 Tax=Cohnella silvisoli TaxID=2873699 RepID=A0ABV1L3R1_9BACL|nr:extracellular solute-binding protein [Cohnella silvisoli]MCD9026188.1 extracellular solute-binding protein [Cohnella silvisoli]
MTIRKQRSKWLVSALCFVLLFSLAACGGTKDETKETQPSTGESASTQEANTEPVTITYSTFRAEDEQIFKKLIDKFQKENPGITVKFDTNKDAGAYYQTLKANIASGQAPDVFDLHPNTNYTDFAKDGVIADLSDQPFVANYQDGPKALTTIDGKIYGFNHAVNLICVIYNKEIFKNHNVDVPKDWNDFVSIVNKLKAEGEGGIAYAGADVKAVWLFNAIANELMSPADYKAFAEGIDNGSIKTIRDNVKIYTALKTLSEYNKQGLLYTNSDGVKYPQSLSLFAQKKAPMVIIGTWTFGTKETDYPGIDVGIFPIPTLEGTQVGYAEPAQISVVNAKSKHIEAAKKWVNFLGSPENATFYVNNAKMTTTVKDVEANFSGADILAAQMEKEVHVFPIFATPNMESYQVDYEEMKTNILFKGADVDKEIAAFEQLLKKADLKNVK